MGERAVILGAGNVGRGFLGQLFAESGYHVTFVDVDRPLVDALRADGAYTLRLAENAGTAEVRVGPVTALLAGDSGAVAEALAGARLAATAVGVRALPHIAPLLAEGVRLRAERGVREPLNVIVCENLKDAARHVRGLLAERLDPAGRAYLAERVGLVDTVIGRMVPEVPAALRAAQPTLAIAEPYKELPVDRAGFVGPVPDVVGMEPADDFAVYTARKLYLHNAGHAVLGYLGYRKGLALGYEALEDPDVRRILDGALEEAVRGIAARYAADEGWLRAHVADLLRRFANRALADPVVRLARDPLRKLAPEDRLVGAARVAERAGQIPVHLAWGIAGALAYDEPSDPLAVALQERIAAQGVEGVMEEVSGIGRAEALGVAVVTRHRILREGGPWA